jgi:hypothetical protein
MGESLYQEYSQPAAIFIIIVSIPVLLTVIIFPSMIRNKVFMEIIVSLVCCDILGNWPYAIGYYPATGNPVCSFAGFCNLFFLRATWLYTVAIVFNLRCLVFYRRAVLVGWYLHSACLGPPLILTLAELSTNPFGNPSHNKVCSVSGNSMDALLWHDTAYSGLLLICVFVMIVFVAELKYLEWQAARNRQQTDTVIWKETYRTTQRYMLLYPVLLGICWLPHVIIGYIKLNTPEAGALGPSTDVLKILHGACIAIRFYVCSTEAQQRWYRLFNALTTTLRGDVDSNYTTAPLVQFDISSTDISIREDFVSDDEIQTALREESVKQLQGSRNSDFGLSAAAMSASSSSQGAGSVSNVRVTAADSGLVRISASSMDTWSVRSGLPSEL